MIFCICLFIAKLVLSASAENMTRPIRNRIIYIHGVNDYSQERTLSNGKVQRNLENYPKGTQAGWVIELICMTKKFLHFGKCSNVISRYMLSAVRDEIRISTDYFVLGLWEKN